MMTLAKPTVYRSPLRYPGGKQKAIKIIAPLLPKTMKEYREPMCGGASVFFHLKSLGVAKQYWINDKFSDLIAFWLECRDHNGRMINSLQNTFDLFPSAKDRRIFFDVLKEHLKDPENDQEAIAHNFYFFNRVTFSGTILAGGFSNHAAIERFTQSSIDRLKEMPTALKDTHITNVDYRHLIQSPGDDVFMFLDPPYITAKKLYGDNGDLHEIDHDELAFLLKRTDHKWLMTYDDSQQVRDLYNWAKISPWRMQYGMNNCNAENTSKLGKEVFISNYEI